TAPPPPTGGTPSTTGGQRRATPPTLAPPSRPGRRATPGRPPRPRAAPATTPGGFRPLRPQAPGRPQPGRRGVLAGRPCRRAAPARPPGVPHSSPTTRAGPGEPPGWAGDVSPAGATCQAGAVGDQPPARCARFTSRRRHAIGTRPTAGDIPRLSTSACRSGRREIWAGDSTGTGWVVVDTTRPLSSRVSTTSGRVPARPDHISSSARSFPPPNTITDPALPRIT